MKRELRLRIRCQVYQPVDERVPWELCKLNPEDCLPPGMVQTIDKFYGSPEKWIVVQIKMQK